MMDRSIIYFFFLFAGISCFGQVNPDSGLITSIQTENIEVLNKFFNDSNINKSLSGKGNPLIFAIENKSPRIVEFFLQKGADPNFEYYSRTPLMFAAIHQNFPIVKLLIKYGASVNARDSLGNTALMIASAGESVKIVKVLIRNGAYLNIRNKKGINARDFAARSNNRAISLYLKNVFERHLPNYIDGPYVNYLGKKKVRISYIKNDSLRKRMDSYNQYFGLKNLTNQFQGFAGDKNNYPLLTRFERPPSELNHVKRLLIIGDVHGQFDTLRLFLQNNRVIDENLHWSFGDGTIVFMGDIFDRGEKVTEALWLIYCLEQEAARQGGTVQLLLGNHEMMVFQEDERFISEKYYYLFKNLRLSYSKSFTNKTLLGRWLRSKNTFLRIDSFLFVHGGLHPNILNYKVSIDSSNRLINKYLNTKRKSNLNNNPYLKFLLSYNGPFWFRGLVEKSDGLITDQDVDEILNSYKVKHIFVGHTFKPDVQLFYEGKVISTDVPFYLPDGYPMQALLLEDNKFVILTSKGERKGFNLQ